MPVRATKRGDERTPIDLDCDVLICGASFAGLAIARELAGATRPDGSPLDVVVIDRYEIGERATSACAAPLPWIEALGLGESVRQVFPELVLRTRIKRFSWKLPQAFCTFDYRLLCQLLAEQGDFTFETAKVEGRVGPDGALVGAGSASAPVGGEDVIRVRTDRGEIRAPLVVDALGWRRVLAPASEENIQPPEAFLSRGLEIHPHGEAGELELFLDPTYVPAGYSWVFPAGHEVRVGVGSFDPRYHVKDPTLKLASDLDWDPVRFQGNWIPHKLRPATGDAIFFAGDSAGHCLPLSAEGIRPALYFGLALGRELRLVVEGHQTREQALRRYAALSAEKEPAYTWLLRFQRLTGWLVPRKRSVTAAVTACSPPPINRRAWSRYLEAFPPSYVDEGPRGDLRPDAGGPTADAARGTDAVAAATA
ncbi:hypothetical protein PAI11_06360 [Patulibacter medicamentivorans]|uniref:NAD(P)/FAD-dependent oxidoreductase n=1 Tax=Patulibacter medicamentivorans TaxID=1097667 RepID=H0E1H4_9ACTN|nr:NAD(P)/FAD-dependent oxidoreductase [Patulibacter medicamentivorans]EHN12459.1 hypothetical protein PAI11_06360 [Patulibacter medicamentivorans]